MAIKIIILILTCIFLSCGPQYVKDPNANVLVTSQYEDEPVKIIFLNSDSCKRQIDCTNKSKSGCAVALYNDSKRIIKEAEKLENKELYLSAKIEYMIAMCRLIEAEILISQAKTDNYDDWVIVTTIGLEKIVKSKIKLCEKKLLVLDFKR